MNPQQSPARVFMKDGGELPIKVLGGSPGYINLLDALNAWQLVRELQGRPRGCRPRRRSSTSARRAPPSRCRCRSRCARACFVDDLELSPLASAYARARGADRLCSFGDFVALSDACDESTALLLAREVSDGVVAPGSSPRRSRSCARRSRASTRSSRIDPAYEPPALESRDVFGVTLEQRRHDRAVAPADFANIVSAAATCRKGAARPDRRLDHPQVHAVQLGLLVADGQTVGVGAGQQSRVHCVRLAGHKADLWRLRHHPHILGLPFRPGIGAPSATTPSTSSSATTSPRREVGLAQPLPGTPHQLTAEEKRTWLGALTGVACGSDAFFPFRDSIDRAAASASSTSSSPGARARRRGHQGRRTSADDDGVQRLVQTVPSLGKYLVGDGLEVFPLLPCLRRETDRNASPAVRARNRRSRSEVPDARHPTIRRLRRAGAAPGSSE